jgi:hypothetical protein
MCHPEDNFGNNEPTKLLVDVLPRSEFYFGVDAIENFIERK